MMMNSQALQFDLAHQRSRLDFYVQQKARATSVQSGKMPALNKWIEIYSERVQKLERQLARAQREEASTAPGLKTDLAAKAEPRKKAARR